MGNGAPEHMWDTLTELQIHAKICGKHYVHIETNTDKLWDTMHNSLDFFFFFLFFFFLRQFHSCYPGWSAMA